MPTIFSHAVFAAVTGKAAVNKAGSVWFWLLIAGCAMMPDADVAAYWFGVPRGSMFAHRGITHSVFFAVVFGAAIAFFSHRFLPIGFSFLKLWACFALATVSHPLLDMLTDGGSGAALFAPFSNERFFFPWRPVEVSPIGMGFFSQRGWTVIASEIIWIWLPAFAVFVAARIIGKRR